VRRTNQNAVSRLVNGGTQPVEDNFPAIANSARSRSGKVVDISALPPGKYELRFAITDSKKRSALRVRQFEIREREQERKQ
jgi:hypothetical protein